jgi:signal transduction histidine kinase
MLAVLVAHNVYSIHAIMDLARPPMEALAGSIIDEVQPESLREHGGLVPAIVSRINSRLEFVDQDGSLAYAVVSPRGEMLYHTPDFNIPVTAKLLRRESKGLFLYAVRSGEGLDDKLRRWEFILKREDDGVVILVSDYRNYELLERVLAGLGVALVASLLLAGGTAFFISRQIVRPLDTVRETALRIKNGDHAARIPQPPVRDERGQLVAALNETFAALEESMNRIKRFSAAAAHELNTPLTVLRGNLEVCLARRRTPEEYESIVSECVSELAGLTDLVKDLLLLSTTDYARLRQGFRMTDLGSTVQDAIAQLEIVSSRKAIRIDDDLASGIEVPGDAMLLARLAYNLIHNAIKFSNPGSSVTVEVMGSGSDAILAVRDSGIGIAPEHLDQIFDRFFQVDASRAHGTGLGLSLVKWVVDLHGGSISVHSRLGTGSAFLVTLPAVPGEDARGERGDTQVGEIGI